MREARTLRIIEGAMKGDEAAFARLMELKARSILYIATSLMHNKADGEDVAQEAVIMIRRDIGKLKKAEAFDSWMYRTVFNACMNAKKKMERTANISDLDIEAMEVPERREDFLPSDFVENEEKRKELIAAVRELPDRYQMCVLMFYFEDMRYEEIAEALDCTVPDVASALSRAKKKLRCKLIDPDRLIEESIQPAPGYAIAGVPVMAAALEMDAKESITPPMIDRFLAGAGRPLGTGTAIVAASFFSRMGGKVAIGIAITLALGTLTAAALVGSGIVENPFAGAGNTTPMTEPGQAGQTNAASNQAAPLTDVLDESQAQELEQFTQGSQSKQAWDDFTRANGLLYLRYTLDDSYQYTVYVYDNAEEQTRLFAIERQSNDGSVEIAYQIGGMQTEAPKGTGIGEAFDAWR